MDKSERRFERDIEAFLISPQGGYVQFNGQDADGNWVHSRQHDVETVSYTHLPLETLNSTRQNWLLAFLVAFKKSFIRDSFGSSSNGFISADIITFL